MKILFVSSHVPDSRWRWLPSYPYKRMDYMPCEVVECNDAECVRKHVSNADVILFSARDAAVSFSSELLFINDSKALIGVFYGDPWGRVYWHDGLRLDLIISSYNKAYKWRRAECEMFLSPTCVSVQPFDPHRDIDILFWGKWKEKYPFRMFIARRLTDHIVGNPVIIDPTLMMHDVILNDRTYKYAVLGNLTRDYYSSKLYEVISRAKICCTGSHYAKIPVGKYFENAACGSLTISNEFSDSEELGFKHKKTIWFTDEARFVDDLSFLLTHDDVRKEISKNARDLIRNKHTPKIRADELYAFLCKKVGEK